MKINIFNGYIKDRLYRTSFTELKRSEGHENDDLNMIPLIHPNPIIDPDGGFHKWGIPNSWMI